VALTEVIPLRSARLGFRSPIAGRRRSAARRFWSRRGSSSTPATAPRPDFGWALQPCAAWSRRLRSISARRAACPISRPAPPLAD